MGHLKENSKSIFSGLNIFGRVPDTDAGVSLPMPPVSDGLVAAQSPQMYHFTCESCVRTGRCGLTTSAASPAETLSQGARKADIFIVVNASTIELPDVEKYIAETVGERPLVLWNLELDTLRADLGTPTLFQSPSTSLLETALPSVARLWWRAGHAACRWLQCSAAFAGLLGFPPKELQYRFLCQFTPVFYIRQRDYSKASLPIPGSLAQTHLVPLV